MLLLSHLYILDHLISTLYTLLFAIVWWVYIPHDGRRVSNSAAQAAMVALAKSRGDIAPAELDMDDEDRALAAAGVWGHEKTFAVAVLLACWVLKVRPVSLAAVLACPSAALEREATLADASPCRPLPPPRSPQPPPALLLARPLLIRLAPPAQHLPRPPALILVPTDGQQRRRLADVFARGLGLARAEQAGRPRKGRG